MSFLFPKTGPESGPPQRRTAPFHISLSIALVSVLAACGSHDIEGSYPDKGNGATEESGSLFDNFSFGFGGNDAASETAAPDSPSSPSTPTGLAVNADLWRAALDTLSFMPIATADPIGGVIATDWYNDPNTPGERVKINVVILGLELRADALSVSLFREKRINDRWASVAGNRQTGRQLENIMLGRARDFKMARIQPAE